MGLFKKAQQAAQQKKQPGPPPQPVSAEDALWESINGISLRDYADLTRDAQARGSVGEAGMIAIGRERGWRPADTKAAIDGWEQRMDRSDAVAQQFSKFAGN